MQFSSKGVFAHLIFQSHNLTKLQTEYADILNRKIKFIYLSPRRGSVVYRSPPQPEPPPRYFLCTLRISGLMIIPVILLFDIKKYNVMR